MRKNWKMRGGIFLLLVGFILSIGSVSWAKSNPYGSRTPQTKEKITQSQREQKLDSNLTPEQRKKMAWLKEKWTQNQRQSQSRERFNLNLTLEQKEKLTHLRLSFQEQTVDIRGELTKKRIELQKLWLKKAPDQVKIFSLIDEISEIEAQINKKTVGYVLRVKEILTPEQLKKLLPLALKMKFGQRTSHFPVPGLNR